MQTTFTILRMHAANPAIAAFLLQSSAGKIEPRLVEIITLPIRARGPDKGLTGIGQGTVFQLAFGKRGFCPHAFGDVDQHDSQDRRSALVLTGHNRFQPGPKRQTGRSQQS